MYLKSARRDHYMLRSALLTATVVLGLGALAQTQLVNYGGFVTTAPTANVSQNPSVVNAQGAPSVPAINTPVAHVGPQNGIANQPGEQAVSPNQPNAAQPAQSEVVQIQNPNPNPLTVEVAPAQNAAQGLNLGAASFSQNPYLTPGTGDNGKSLGEVAREIKQKDQNLNAKTYTNSDIDRMNQATGISSTTTNASNYPANNGVITAPSNNQNTIAAPTQNQSTTGTEPLIPRSSGPLPTTNHTPNAPAPQPRSPQASARPPANGPYEMAANNPANSGIPQAGNERTAAANRDNGESDRSNRQLPKTASRLPLIGILGFFSISMGFFVRYQRAKDSK